MTEMFETAPLIYNDYSDVTVPKEQTYNEFITMD